MRKGVRRVWKIKPFTRVKASEKVYRRTEKKPVRHEYAGRILALDFGEKRVGMAISDPLQLTAQGLRTVADKTGMELLSTIRGLIQEYDVIEVVLGYPLLMSGEEGDMARAVRQFAEKLGHRASVPVILWDERLSSKQAEKVIRQSGSSPKKGKVDEISACLILQSYLDSIRG